MAEGSKEQREKVSAPGRQAHLLTDDVGMPTPQRRQRLPAGLYIYPKRPTPRHHIINLAKIFSSISRVKLAR